MKFSVAGHDDVRSRLTALGARQLCPMLPEDNWVLDDAQGSLARAGRLLRLRRFGDRTRLTFKGAGVVVGGIKSRPEHEVEVGDPESTRALLAGLGFIPVRRYQKRRELWRFDEVEIALDTTPMGNFVELEGAADRLAALAVDLGLDPTHALADTYLGLWGAYRRSHPEASEDMLFA